MERHEGLNQSLEGIKALASIPAGAICLYVAYEVTGVFLDDAASRAPGGYGGAQANVWINTGLDQVLPVAFLLLVFFGLVMSGVLSRRY